MNALMLHLRRKGEDPAKCMACLMLFGFLEKKLQDAGFPVEGDLAYNLYEWANDLENPRDLVYDTLDSLGYQRAVTYPLLRRPVQ